MFYGSFHDSFQVDRLVHSLTFTCFIQIFWIKLLFNFGPLKRTRLLAWDTNIWLTQCFKISEYNFEIFFLVSNEIFSISGHYVDKERDRRIVSLPHSSCDWGLGRYPDWDNCNASGWSTVAIGTTDTKRSEYNDRYYTLLFINHLCPPYCKWNHLAYSYIYICIYICVD